MSDYVRLVVVDETGRFYDRTGVKVELDDQDGGKTLKVFVTPLPRDEEIKAVEDHRDALGEAFGRITQGFVNRLLGDR